MKKKVEYNKWTTEQLQKQVKNLKFATGLLAGLLIVLLIATLYISVSEKRFHPLLITPLALSIVIPLNYKRARDINNEIDRRNSSE